MIKYSFIKRTVMVCAASMAFGILSVHSLFAASFPSANAFTDVTTSGITVTPNGTNQIFTVSLSSNAKMTVNGMSYAITNAFEFFVLGSNLTGISGTNAQGPSSDWTFGPNGTKKHTADVAGFSDGNKKGTILTPGGPALVFDFGSPVGGLSTTDPYGLHVSSSYFKGGTGFIGFLPSSDPPPGTPEPTTTASFALGGFGLLGLMVRARRSRRVSGLVV